jgi:uncharacterized repeat protein (TIGR03803 family)
MTRLSAWKKVPVPRNRFLPARVVISAVVISILALAITAQAQVFTTLVNFHGSNGDSPLLYGSLIQGIDGNMYGTTRVGGAHGGGTLFVVTPAGKLTTLYNFCSQNECADGAGPYSGLVLATDGNFYGTTNEGGAKQAGTIFRVTPRGSFTTLYSFPSDNSGHPSDSLIQGSDGALYGTTSFTVFKISLTGVFKVLDTFHGSDGNDAIASLIQASDGNFYGTTSGGGTGFGTIYRIAPSGAMTTLYSFCSQVNCADGNGPYAPLVQGLDGNLYGTTSTGGASGCCGTIFKMSLDGVFTTLHVFTGTDGVGAYGGLLQATDGNFYGMTSEGGSSGGGTLYEITPDGALTTLHNFDGNDGDRSVGGLFQYTTGILYGPTTQGGNVNGGTLFSLATGLGPFVSLVRNPTKVGQQFGILGQGLKGTTSVSLNGQSAAFSVKSDTLILATVPPSATTGFVTVATPSGTLTSNVPFRVLQ